MKKIKLLTGTGRSGLFGAVMAFLAVTFGFSSCRPEFDLDKRFPSELGTSIYETLNEGFDGHTFKCFVTIIDSLQYRNVLEKTGSKTLFVADDEAFKRFLAKCPLAKNQSIRFEDLTISQMKQIFYGSMLNNVYQVAALSNTEGPTIGDCMRRLTSSGIYDSVRVMLPDDMPSTPYWSEVKNDPKNASGIVILEDGTQKPMIIFSDKFLEKKGIERKDYDFLFNLPAGTSKNGEASVNGIRIQQGNKKCFNGFIHVMEDVVYLLPSMAEYLAMSDPNENDPKKTSIIYSSILERFSSPYEVRSTAANRTYPVGGLTTSNTHYNNILQQVDKKNMRLSPEQKAALANKTVYTKLFLSKRNQGSDILQISSTKDTIKESSLLKFDPGWNSYFVTSISDDATALQQNMGVMIVPTDEAMMDWWLNKGGKEMREKYGIAKYKYPNAPSTPAEVAEDMDSIDLNVIVKLLNNTMLASLVSTVPSKFKDVLNDAQDPLWEGIADPKSTIDRVAMCCNGAIYFSNYVPTPTSYRSVAYPALVSEKLKIMDWAIEDEDMSFIYYLNAMQISYSLFLPQTSSDPKFEDKIVWVDPASFAIKKYNAAGSEGKSLKAIVFGYNEDSRNKVYADIYDYDEVSGEPVGSPLNTSGPITNLDFLRNRLEDILNYHIIVTTRTGETKRGVESTIVDQSKYSFYRTKGGGAVRFKMGNVTDPKTNFANMEVDGGWQIETGQKVKIVDRFDMYERSFGNGITYIIDKPLMTSRMSVYDILSDSVKYPKFNLFFKLMQEAKLFSSTSNGTEIGSTNCVNFFSTFNYTVYVPQSDSIQALFDNGKLYSPDFLNNLYTLCDSIHDSIYEEYGLDKESADSAWLEYRIAKSRELRKAAVADADTHEDSVFEYNEFIDKQRDVLTNFVKYHIQDNSVYVNPEFNFGESDYQTAYMRASDKRYIKLTVDAKKDGLTLWDAKYDKYHPEKSSIPRHVITDDENYYNIMCREYEFKEGFGSDAKATGSVTDVTKTKLETSSYAVIHLIDGPLYNGEF
jgi:hypothetical protein